MNPKTHDSLFKWLITAFTAEFFAHYFPAVRVGSYTFIDKEFISKYEALKESLKGDLFLAMEVELDGQVHEVIIQIEHAGKKQDLSRRVYRYACYAWLLREKPVWSIVIYTDETVWRKPVPDSFWYAFDSVNGKQWHRFDVIKLKAEKSAELIQKHSLLCKLLALKADDRGTDTEYLIREIYHAVAEMKGQLTDEHLLLVDQWVDAYKKIPDKAVDQIRKENQMTFIATTLTEHIRHEAELVGEARGRLEGEAKGKLEGMREGIREGKLKGKLEGEITLLENLYQQGILSKTQYAEMIEPLRREQVKRLLDAGKHIEPEIS